VVKNDDFGQISFGSLGREAALEMLEKTNIDELSDGECRELLRDMLKAIQQ
jgi:DNA mismatch repair protein MutS